MFKPEYRVESFRSAEEFQEFLTKLTEGWQLHSFAQGSVAWAIAVFWTVPPPMIVVGSRPDRPTLQQFSGGDQP